MKVIFSCPNWSGQAKLSGTSCKWASKSCVNLFLKICNSSQCITHLALSTKFICVIRPFIHSGCQSQNCHVFIQISCFKHLALFTKLFFWKQLLADFEQFLSAKVQSKNYISTPYVIFPRGKTTISRNQTLGLAA